MGLGWTRLGCVRLLQPGAPGDQGSRVDPAAVLSILLPRPAQDEAPRAGSPAGAAMLPSAAATSREPDGVGLGMGQKWQCLFFSDLGGVCNLTLV